MAATLILISVSVSELLIGTPMLSPGRPERLTRMNLYRALAGAIVLLVYCNKTKFDNLTWNTSI